MHWIIFAELKKFVEQQLGPEAWDPLVQEAGLGSKSFLAKIEYPDSDGAKIVGAACRRTGLPAAQILEAFGEFLVPDYLAFYGMLVRPEWRTLDTIENTEQMIHAILRVRDPNAKPPELKVERVAKDQVVIRYDSHRRMCGVAKGIARGVARNYGEKIEIVEPECMHAGARACVISVRLVP